MKSHTFTSRGVIVLALLVWALQGMAPAQLPESIKSADLNKELDIFGSVIKDSLSEKGIVKGVPSAGGKTYGTYGFQRGMTGMPMAAPGMIGKSPFDWNLRCQYIPTVGAIYTIPVSFPLVNPEKETEEPEAAETKEEELDLWEKHERGVQDERQPGTVPLPPNASEAMGMMYQPGMPGAGDPFGQNMGPMGFGGPAVPAYDPGKVKSLRAALIDVLAEYGCRLTDLPEDEQILFIVTSEGGRVTASGSVFIKSSGGKKSTEVFLPAAAAAESGSGDQYLLAIKKGELTAKHAPEEIEDKLTERVF